MTDETAPTTPSEVTPETVIRIGRILYGSNIPSDRWQSYLARDVSRVLGRPVASATISQWLGRRRPIPDYLPPVLIRLCLEAQAQLMRRANRAWSAAIGLQVHVVGAATPYAELAAVPYTDEPAADEDEDPGPVARP